MSEAEPATIVDTPSAEPAVAATPEPVAAAPAQTWQQQHLSADPDLLANPMFERMDSVAALAKEHANAQKLIGADKVVIPGDDATEEEVRAFRTKLGVPLESKDYDLSGIEVPEGLPWDEGFQTSMVDSMHKHGLSQAQVQGVLADYIESVGGQYQEVTGEAAQSRESALKDMRTEWGRSAPAQEQMAKSAFQSFAGENWQDIAGIQLADGGVLGDNVDFIRTFANVGSKMQDHGLVGASNAPSRTTFTPGEAQAKVNQIVADSSSPYYSKSHPEHDAAVQQVSDLMEMAHPEPIIEQ